MIYIQIRLLIQLIFSLLQDENRYRVAKGSKFYRIKLAPIPSRAAARRERTECKSTNLEAIKENYKKENESGEASTDK